MAPFYLFLIWLGLTIGILFLVSLAGPPVCYGVIGFAHGLNMVNDQSLYDHCDNSIIHVSISGGAAVAIIHYFYSKHKNQRGYNND